MSTFVNRWLGAACVGAAVILVGSPRGASAADVGTAFTYQGSLSDGGVNATGIYDFLFTPFDAAAAGNMAGHPITLEDVQVVSGVFSVELDFGSGVFAGAARWLQVEVRPGASTGAFSLLPRQKLSAAPYAIGVSLPAVQWATSGGPIWSVENRGTGNGASFSAAGDVLNYGVVGTTSSTASQAAGVRGEAVGPSGLNIGVQGIGTTSPDGTGVVGAGNATGGYFSATNNNSVGVYAYGGGTGVYADASNGLSTGLYAKGGYRGIYAESRGIGPALEARRASGTGDLILAANANGNQFWVDNSGVTHTKVLEILGGADLSERFDIGHADEAIPAGSVVSIDPERQGRLVLSHEPYDRRVAGVVSGAGGVKPGMLMGQNGSIATGAHPVALTGRVYVRATADNGPITPGDLLTTSPRPGLAMRASDPERAHGAILGKAMGSLEHNDGLVLVLVGLQ